MPEYRRWVKHGEEEKVNVTDEAIKNNNNDQDHEEGWNKEDDLEHDGTEDDDEEETDDEIILNHQGNHPHANFGFTTKHRVNSQPIGRCYWDGAEMQSTHRLYSL
jgi:hypothetical protein